MIFDGVALSLTAVDQGGQPLALVQVVGHHSQDRYADLAVLRLAESTGGSAVAGAVLGLDQAFKHFDLRKIYFQTSDPASIAIASAISRFLVVEGILHDHLWIDGQYVDVTISSLTRESFRELLRTEPLARSIQPADGWFCLDGAAAATPTDWAHFESLVAALAEPEGAVVHLDSMALLELLSALDDLAGHEIDVGALADLTTRDELLALGRSLYDSNRESTAARALSS
jgi:hypothetical protein